MHGLDLTLGARYVSLLLLEGGCSMRIVVLSVFMGLTVGAGGTPPINHSTRYADYEQARISPTGKYLAVTTKQDDYEYVTVIELVRFLCASGHRNPG